MPGPDGKPIPAIDFISTVDTPYINELNIWYHTLNAGYRARISGETDFPCIYGERVGLGRSYVKQTKLDYSDWVQGIREGHATAVLAASIFHFGTYTIAEAKTHMAKAGLPMRQVA